MQRATFCTLAYKLYCFISLYTDIAQRLAATDTQNEMKSLDQQSHNDMH
jgi:hypothetical protein